MLAMEEEKQKLKDKVKSLEDRLEEVEWAKGKLEEQVKEYEERERKTESIMKEVKNEARERREREIERREVEKEDRKKELKEVEERIAQKLAKGSEGEQSEKEGTYKCVIFTDSNGREATADSVRSHMPRDERGRYDIDIKVAYRVEDATQLVLRREIDVAGRYVVIDDLTNNVRGNVRQPADTPEQLVERVDQLRRALLSASAAAVVVMEVKPMRYVDVRPYNYLLSSYLMNCQAGYGSKTMIQMEHLKYDGYHVSPMFGSVLDRSYACALLGTHVPCPTLPDGFTPEFVRRRMEESWPRLGNRGWGGGP